MRSIEPGMLREFRVRCFASPRNDELHCFGLHSFFNILNTPLAMAIQRLSTVTSVVMKIRLRVERTTRGLRDQDLADLAGLDEMRVHLHGRQRRLARDVSRGHAAGAVRERHQHAALHQAAAVVVLVLRDQRIFMLAVDDALPQRPDQMQEARGLDDGPAGGLELSPRPCRSCPVIPTAGDELQISRHFINRRRVVVKRDDPAIRRYHQAEYRSALRGASRGCRTASPRRR